MAHPAGKVRQLNQRTSSVSRYLNAALAALCIAVPAAAMGGKPAHPAAGPAAAAPAPAQGPVEPEALLVKTLRAIQDNKLELALTEVEQVLRAYPNFRLAHLIKGDLLLARAQPLKTMGGATGVPLDRGCRSS